MTIRTVTYDDATHVVVPRNPTEEMCLRMMVTNGSFNKYCAAITEAPPFTSLPNPDLDLIEQALADFKIDGAVSPIALNKAFAALKRIKGDV